VRKVRKVIKEIEDPKETLAQLAKLVSKAKQALLEPRVTWAHRDPRVTKETREILDFVEKKANGESVANKGHREYKVKQEPPHQTMNPVSQNY
jgi:hypothetical protein